MKPHDVSPASGPRRAKQGHVGRGALALHPNGKNGASAAGASGGRLDEKQILVALTALKKGDFSVRLPVDWTGMAGRISDTLNDVMRRKSRGRRAYLAGELFAGYASPDGLGRAAVAQARRPPRRAR